MQLRLCGGFSGPDWFLTESGLLFKIKNAFLEKLIERIINAIMNRKNHKEICLSQQDLQDAGNVSYSDLKAVVAVIHFIIIGAAKYDVKFEILFEELTQIGISLELSQFLVSIMRERLNDIREILIEKSMTIYPTLDANIPIDWRLHQSTNELHPNIQLDIPIHTPSRERSFIRIQASQEKLRLLHSELIRAYSILSVCDQNL